MLRIRLQKSFPALKKRYIEKKTGIVSAYYDTASGIVHFEGLQNMYKTSSFERESNPSSPLGVS